MPALNFEGQNLVGNSFRGQNLNGSTFFKARLENVRFDPNSVGTRTQLRGTNFGESFWLNVDARSAIFAPNATFGPANLSLAALNNVNLSGANLTQVNLSLADLNGVNLTNAILIDANLDQADLSGEPDGVFTTSPTLT